jgi:uncharacterized membrane protein YbhN (UPF0104 family)
MKAETSDFQLGRLLRLVAGIALIVLLVQFALEGGAVELVRQLSRIQWWEWLLLCGLSILVYLSLSRVFQTSILVIKVKMSFLDAFDYSAMNNFFNTILPMKGGLWVRGMYLKKRFDISWARYLFVMASGQVIQLALLGAIAVGFYLVGRLPLFLPTMPRTPELIVVVAVVVLIIVVAIVRLETVAAFANRGIRGLKLWIEDPLLLARYLLETLVFHGLTALRIWLAFVFVGVTMTPTEMCVLYAALAAGLSWAVTPGNIGVKEAAIVLLAAMLGVDTDAAIAASIIDTLAALLVTITVGGWSAYRVSTPKAAT